ncbi:MAG: protein kinase domain-containing protein [Chloroflexaceae bacterium]
MNLPRQIGNYALEHPLGRGASSQVWLARHRQLRDHVVAVKVLTDQDLEAVRRFQREAAIAARLRHPHIVQIYDYGVIPPLHYAILEYVDGVSLRERLARQGRLPLPEALAIFRQIAQALDYAHDRNIVHCDVSPANILIERQGNRAVLTDFGIARDGDAGVRRPHVAMGTPGYLSPEHANPSAAVTHLSDIYCLGVVFYHMLVGTLPWPAPPGLPDGPPFGPPTPPGAHGLSGVPAAIDGVFARLLALDPAHRFPSAGAAVEALDLLFKRHDQPTQVLGTSVQAPARTLQLEAGDPAPAPVEVVLGPDLAPDPLRRAARRATELRDPAILSDLLDAYAAEGRFGLRRRRLGRLARFHKAASRNVFFYRLRVLYERRSQAETDEAPDRQTAEYPLKLPLDRWAVSLPPAREFANQAGGRVFIPGSTRVVTCDSCAGLGVIVCAQCQGRRRVYAPRPAISVAVGATSEGEAAPDRLRPDRRTEASSADAAAGAILVPCPACNGRGGSACDRCAGAGRLLQRQAFHWSRQARTLEGQDEHPALDREWLLRACTPEVVYCQAQAGAPRPEWSLVPPLADLLAEARAAENDETRIVLAEVTISFVPVTDVVFDLGQPGDAGLYRLTIYGFENRIPPDWRFLDWERVIFIWIIVSLALVAAILGVFALL